MAFSSVFCRNGELFSIMDFITGITVALIVLCFILQVLKDGEKPFHTIKIRASSVGDIAEIRYIVFLRRRQALNENAISEIMGILECSTLGDISIASLNDVPYFCKDIVSSLLNGRKYCSLLFTLVRGGCLVGGESLLFVKIRNDISGYSVREF